MITLGTQAMNFRKARAANATDASFPARVPTVAEPSGEGVIDLLTRTLSDGEIQNAAVLAFVGTGADDATLSARVIGWRKLPRGSAAFDLWVPVTLCELALTLSTSFGVANTPVVAAERFADTITLVGTSGNDDISIDIVSPADNTIAHVVLDAKGFQKLEVTFDMDTATDGNALLSLL